MAKKVNEMPEEALKLHLVQYGCLTPSVFLKIARTFKQHCIFKAQETNAMALVPHSMASALKTLPLDLSEMPTAIRGVKINPSMHMQYGISYNGQQQAWKECTKRLDFKGGYSHFVVDPAISTEVQELLWSEIKLSQLNK